ncbi:MAG: PLDc N-terminal domain-containing protein, partial [Prevotellaceae bacterium]|nr:PLDc N-terminal domain-containing protein [Prevotellaceae bacterium]
MSVVSIILESLYIVLIISAIFVMLLENRNPVRSLAWLLVMIFVPYVGLLLYLIIGMNMPKNHIIQRKSIKNLSNNPTSAFDWDKFFADGMDISSIKLCKLLRNNGNSLGYVANNIDVLSNGESSFESIFETIKSA